MAKPYRLPWHDIAVEKTYSTPLIDKLKIQPNNQVAIIKPVDPDGSFHQLLKEQTDNVTDDEPLPNTDLVFLAADSVPELSSLPNLRSRIRSNSTI